MEVMEPTAPVVRCEFEREGIVVPPAARFMGRDPEFALSVFDLTPQSVEQITARCRVEPQPIREGDGFHEHLLIGPEQTDCFVITRLTITDEATVNVPSCVHVAVVAEGTGVVSAGGDRIELQPGVKFLAAAAAESLRYVPEGGGSTILLCRPGGDG